jgi:hypothetical protein
MLPVRVVRGSNSRRGWFIFEADCDIRHPHLWRVTATTGAAHALSASNNNRDANIVHEIRW